MKLRYDNNAQLPNNVHIEMHDGIWYVYRGNKRTHYASPERRIAEKEMQWFSRREYQLLVSSCGTIHPQWRFEAEGPITSWFHFSYPPGHKLAYFECVFWSLSLAKAFMTRHGITDYLIIDGEPAHYPDVALRAYDDYRKRRQSRAGGLH